MLEFGQRLILMVAWVSSRVNFRLSPQSMGALCNRLGFETAATSLLKKTFAKESVATLEQLWVMCVESGARLIG